MFRLEEKLQPTEAPASKLRDLMGLSLLLAMMLMLLPSYGLTWSTVSGIAGTTEERAALAMVIQDAATEMAGYCLLPAVGFLLCLRHGAIDLSVWVNMSLGGAVAATLIARGISPVMAFFAAGVCGLALGTLSGLLVAKRRWPSPLVTFGISLLITTAFRLLGGNQQHLHVPDNAFYNWNLPPGLPLSVTGFLFVAGLYCAIMVSIIFLGSRLPAWQARHNPLRLGGSLAISGMLSALGGTAWLISNPYTPLPTNPVGDLRIPAAALLAGGVLLAGRGRTLLALSCLPMAMLLATIWRLEIVGVTLAGAEMQMVLLIAMTAVVHLTIARRPNLYATWGGAPMYLTMLGLIVTAASADPRFRFSSKIAVLALGTGLWLLGAGLLLFQKKTPSLPANAAK